LAGSVSELREWRAPADRAQRYDRVLLELSMCDAVTRSDLSDALRVICQTSARTLEVGRAGVWLYDEAFTRLTSRVVFESSSQSFLPSLEIRAADNPPYFEALEQERVLAIDDACRDERTKAFTPGYLKPLGISSMLDAPIRSRGRLLGVVCHEHTGPARTWDPEEERFAASLGDLVAVALAADERTRAETALRESEACYRLLVDGARDLIFNLDPAGTVRSLNPALETLLGWQPSAWVGRHFARLVHPDDLGTALELFGRAISGEPLPTFEIRLQNAAGQPIWFEFTISALSQYDGIASVFGVGREVTARKRAEVRRRVLDEVGRTLTRCGENFGEALALAHEALARELPCDRIATVVSDPETGALTVTSCRHSAGRAAADAEGAEGFAPEDLVRRAMATNAVQLAGASEHAVVAAPLRCPDGTIGALVAERAGRIGFDAEQVELCQSAARELALAITAERRRQEQEENAFVAESLAHLGQELITSLDLPVLLDRLCRSTAEVLGCDSSHTFLLDENGTFEQVASHGDPPQLTEVLRSLPITAEQSRGLVAAMEREWVVLSRPGDGLLADHLWEAYGTTSAIIIALRRGSRLVGAQSAALRAGHGEFGRRHVRIALGLARLASLAIANARLVAELEAASRLKSDFVATMSHELRTPLNVILGYNEILLEELGSLDPGHGEALHCMRSSAMELLELIEATLDLSRLEAGRAPLQLADVDLRAWMDEVRHETVALRAAKNQLSFDWRAPNEVHAHTDALKLKVILKNLLSNAIKFTAAGSIDVAVAQRDGKIEISVRDTGIGMSPETQAVMFEAYRQGDGSMTREYGGVGLGLYIVSRLVDALCGTIEVESEPGRGSTFRVRVPADARTTRGLAG
jgi:PAS domain S-box-containing protein